MFGGDGEDTNTFDLCYYAQIQGDGSLGTWQTGTTLPNTWWFPGVCTINNDIIATGGILNDKDRGNSTDKVYVCQTNPSDGSMGAWVEQTEALPEPGYNYNFVAAGDTVFCIGGRDNVAGESKDCVWRATYDSGTHTVGAWTEVDAQLPLATQYHMAVYSDTSKSIYVTNLRHRGATNIYTNGVYISDPLFDRPVPTETAPDWVLYE
jgi:hypothetical protein